jgi:hypothetical protein
MASLVMLILKRRRIALNNIKSNVAIKIRFYAHSEDFMILRKSSKRFSSKIDINLSESAFNPARVQADGLGL